MMGTEQLDTSRLHLRRQRTQDAEAIAALLNDWNVVRWIPIIPYPYCLDDARQWIARTLRNWADGSDHQFVVTLRDGGKLIGHMGLRPDGNNGAELGYWLGERYWGLGYAKEAVRAVIDHGFGTMGLARIWANVHRENHRSIGVLLASGLRSMGTRPITNRATGETVAGLSYVLDGADHDASGA